MNKIRRTIFIASSSEERGTAMMIVRALQRCNKPELPFSLQPLHWENADTNFNQTLLHALVKFPKKYDYGCFLFTPNDTVLSMDMTSLRVRDNVIFEFGLFASQEEGLRKSFIMHPNDTKLKLASDLFGIITAVYIDSDTPEYLEMNIGSAAEQVFKAIAKYEQEKIEKSEMAVKNSLENLKEKLQKAREHQQPEIILSALRELAETKAQALNQSTIEVLKDILTWTNTILDITDADELAKLQNGDLRSVWVYSSLPIELDNKLPLLKEKFKTTVLNNIAMGIKYTYFLDSEELLDELEEFAKLSPGNIEACIIEPYCVTSNYVFHFYKDNSISVYQNIVRRGKLESLVKLEYHDANILHKKVQSRYELSKASKKGNLSIRK